MMNIPSVPLNLHSQRAKVTVVFQRTHQRWQTMTTGRCRCINNLLPGNPLRYPRRRSLSIRKSNRLGSGGRLGSGLTRSRVHSNLVCQAIENSCTLFSRVCFVNAFPMFFLSFITCFASRCATYGCFDILLWVWGRLSLYMVLDFCCRIRKS